MYVQSCYVTVLQTVVKRSPDLHSEDFRKSENIYTPFEYHNEFEEESSPRSRRDLSDEKKKRTCTLFLQSDTMLWERMTGDKNSGGLAMVSWILF